MTVTDPGPDIATLQAAHDAAAVALGEFEAAYEANELEWLDKRQTVADAYRAADAALQAALNVEATAAAQVIEPDPLVGELAGGEVG